MSKAFPTPLQRLKQVEQERKEAHTAATNLAHKVNELWAQVATLQAAIQNYNAAWLNEKEPGITARVERERIQSTHVQRQKLFDAADKTPQDAAQYVRGLEDVVKIARHVVALDDVGNPVEVDRRLQNLDVALERLDALAAQEDRG